MTVDGVTRPKRATLREVAALAGVSPTTASFVLNDRPGFQIASETRERVRSAARQLEYRPHHVARSLSRGRSTLIGVLVADLANPYSWQIVQAVDRAANRAGYSPVLFEARRSQSNARERVQRMLSLDLDGLLITHPSNVADYLDAQTRGSVRATPAVCCGGSPESSGRDLLPGCYVDGPRTGYVATRHLIERGHRRIAFLADQLPWARDWDRAFVRARPRYRGYAQALLEAGLPVEEQLLFAPPARDAGVDEVLREGLRGLHPPTAIVAYNDMAAFGAYRVVAGLGGRIPDDLAVVGVDDVPLAAQMYPPLTTASQRVDETAEVATRMLLRMIDEPSYPGEAILLDPELVIRAST